MAKEKEMAIDVKAGGHVYVRCTSNAELTISTPKGYFEFNATNTYAIYQLLKEKIEE